MSGLLAILYVLTTRSARSLSAQNNYNRIPQKAILKTNITLFLSNFYHFRATVGYRYSVRYIPFEMTVDFD